jgi:hypothetical protein
LSNRFDQFCRSCFIRRRAVFIIFTEIQTDMAFYVLDGSISAFVLKNLFDTGDNGVLKCALFLQYPFTWAMSFLSEYIYFMPSLLKDGK